MKTHPFLLASALLILVLRPAVHADPINPAVVAIKDWLLYTPSGTAAGGLDNGMRKSLTYYNTSHSFSGSTVSYSVLQSSAVARTLKFLSEYYLTYQNDLSSTQKSGIYSEIQNYVNQLLRHRKYSSNWGWDIADSSLRTDANLEMGKFYSGAVATSENYKMFTGLGNAFACEALVAAAKVADLRGDSTRKTSWLNSAKLIGNFLCRLADPYDYYSTSFGAYCMVDASNTPIKKAGLVFSMVSSFETLATDVPLQNLYAIVALKDLSSATGITSYQSAAIQIRDAMAPGLSTFNAGFYPKTNDNGSGKLIANDYSDNQWHALSSDQVGDDNIEYALAAIWQFEGMSAVDYTFTYTGTSVEFDMIDVATPFHTAPAKNFPGYFPYISFTGYFQKIGGVWKHQMPYYDMVGFGLLGELRRSIMYSDYLVAWNELIKAKVDAGDQADLVLTMMVQDLVTDEFRTYWTSTHETSKSTLASVAIGLSLMKITPYYTSTTQP